VFQQTHAKQHNNHQQQQHMNVSNYEAIRQQLEDAPVRVNKQEQSTTNTKNKMSIGLNLNQNSYLLYNNEMVLFNDSDFASYGVNVPQGQSSLTENGAISKIKSDGWTQQVLN
jgi:GTP cyclohydrolase I